LVCGGVEKKGRFLGRETVKITVPKPRTFQQKLQVEVGEEAVNHSIGNKGVPKIG